MKFHEAYLGVYQTTDPRDSEYDPILVKAYQNLSYLNLSPYKERCSTCGNRDYGISYPLTMEFKCRSCLLNDEMNRLHSIPEEERGYRVWKLKKARKDHALKAKIVEKLIAKVPMDDLDSVAELKPFFISEYERFLR